MTNTDEFAGFSPADEFAGFDAAPSQTAEPSATPSHTAATDYYGPDPNVMQKMVHPVTGDYVDAPAWKAAGFRSAEEFTNAHRSGENFAAGVGKAFVDLGRGAHQLYAKAADALNPLPQTISGLVSGEHPTRSAGVQSDIDESRALDAPLMETTAGRAGNIVGQTVPILALPSAGILGSAAEGAALGAAQPVATGDSRLQNAGMGALGGGAGAAVGKVASGVLGGFGGAGARQAAVDTLKGEGIPLTVAQTTGKKLAQTVERASGMTSDAGAEFAAEQGQAFNRAVLKRIGVTDPEVTAATPDVLGPARSKITGVMDDVASRTKVNVDNHLLNDMVDVEQSAMRQLPASDIGPISQNLKDILENASHNGGSLDGTFYQKLNSNLGALSRNPSTAPIASDLQEAIHDALQRSANPDDIAALAKARQQYRALKQIEPAVDASTGNISVPKLMNSLSVKANRNQTLYGKGDQSLVNLARAAKHVIPDNLGNSGSAERAVPILGAMETLGSGEPIKAGIKLGVGTLGLNAAGKAMRSQGVMGKYLASGMGAPGRAAAPVVTRVAPAAGYGLAETEPREEPIARAAGGKVDVESLVSRLMNRWKAAKKVTDASTKPLLRMSDSAVARALDIAQEHL